MAWAARCGEGDVVPEGCSMLPSGYPLTGVAIVRKKKATSAMPWAGQDGQAIAKDSQDVASVFCRCCWNEAMKHNQQQECSKEAGCVVLCCVLG